MVKTAVQRKSSAPVAQDDIGRSLAVLAARKQFITAAMSMGWQLAGMVIIPVIIGVKLDERFQTTPSYTLVALLLAVGGAVMVVRATINQVNRESATGEPSAQADQEEKKLHAK